MPISIKYIFKIADFMLEYKNEVNYITIIGA